MALPWALPWLCRSPTQSSRRATLRSPLRLFLGQPLGRAALAVGACACRAHGPRAARTHLESRGRGGRGGPREWRRCCRPAAYVCRRPGRPATPRVPRVPAAGTYRSVRGIRLGTAPAASPRSASLGGSARDKRTLGFRFRIFIIIIIIWRRAAGKAWRI